MQDYQRHYMLRNDISPHRKSGIRRLLAQWPYLIVLLLTVTFIACAPVVAPPAAESGSGMRYMPGTSIPYTTTIFHVGGVVVGDVASLVTQQRPAQATMYQSSSGYGYGTFYGEQTSGKGFVRLLVEYSDTNVVHEGKIAILKVEDSKGSALLPGDYVSFKCRAQYEALSTVMENEKLEEDGGVWELDYCRMATPEITVINK